jgi:microcystin-dependent protein
MSFRTSISQQIINNVFYENSNVDVNENILDSIASVNYVNDEVLNITTDISNINNDITNLNTAITDLQNQIDTLNNSIVRITGSIFILVSSIAPEYSLYCDGSSYLVEDYQNLFNVIGYAYGGSGLYFNVPNMKNSFLLGGNGTLNNVSASNLISGNGTSGATNNFYISGNSYPATNFPILTFAPPHTHLTIDPGHSHSIGDYPNYGSFSGSTTPFVNSTQNIDSFPTSVSKTGIGISNQGTNIQQIDPISGSNGVNITPPFFSVNFYINT